MKKDAQRWSVRELRDRLPSITFPEFQREPTIWSKGAKQRLIDSMLRDFDVSSLYFYKVEEGQYECIDGRQRMAALQSFFGDNPDDPDNGFAVRIANEIFVDDDHPFQMIDSMTWAELLEADGDSEDAAAAVQLILDYQLTIVILSQATTPLEFNLQFTRLNLGATINAGEKLHAMVGDMRDACFDDDGIGNHEFLHELSIPTRRFARQQVMAQILLQVFSLGAKKGYARARHFDAERAFKRHLVLEATELALIDELAATMSALQLAFDGSNPLRNRAMTVSVVLQAWQLGISRDPELARQYVEFIRTFLSRLSDQVGRGLDIEVQYRHLADFQRHITQASVERPAVEARAKRLDIELDLWQSEHRLTGDN